MSDALTVLPCPLPCRPGDERVVVHCGGRQRCRDARALLAALRHCAAPDLHTAAGTAPAVLGFDHSATMQRTRIHPLSIAHRTALRRAQATPCGTLWRHTVAHCAAHRAGRERIALTVMDGPSSRQVTQMVAHGALADDWEELSNSKGLAQGLLQ